MFISRLRETSPELIDYTLYLHRQGRLLPDTFVLDKGIIGENAELMLKSAKNCGIELYYMLKQIGRNPLVAHMLDDMGYAGAVAVDFREALSYIDAGVKVGHVGNLVQVPQTLAERIVSARPEIITVFSAEKAELINACAARLGIIQAIQLRMFDEDGPCYPGQRGGFTVKQLPQLTERLERMRNISIGGVCAFPCFLCDDEGKSVSPTGNIRPVMAAAEYLKTRGHDKLQINLSSVVCTSTLPMVAKAGGNYAEPGHGLTGTTPLHKNPGQPERIGYLYLTEVSHNADGKACCFGGGRYPRGHLATALCGGSADSLMQIGATAVEADNIDYHFELDSERPIGETVMMCYRAQMFTARSSIAVVDSRKGELLGIYTTGGEKAKY